MKVFFGLSQIRKYRRPVVAIGVFDGLHLAHRQILKYVVNLSRRIKGTSVVVTFWPHPQKENNLCSLEHRLRLISELGIEVCIVIRFNKSFSRISAEDFIKDILIKKINAHYICVGKNFKFGKKAKGDFRTLNKLSKVYNFKLKVFDVIKINHRSISSTYIRRLITQGNLQAAARLLCRSVSILGSVIKGISLAKRLGFPTANIDPHHEVLPPVGVYAVKIILNHKRLSGICYIGKKPTFKDRVSQLRPQRLIHIEVYIFNFKKIIYGRHLEIQFINKIRDEKKFDSCAALVEQVKKDIAYRKTKLPPPDPPRYHHNI